MMALALTQLRVVIPEPKHVAGDKHERTRASNHRAN